MEGSMGGGKLDGGKLDGGKLKDVVRMEGSNMKWK